MRGALVIPPRYLYLLWMHSDIKPSNVLEIMEREKARLLAQAAAIDRDMAELNRLASKYNLVVSAPDEQASVPHSQGSFATGAPVEAKPSDAVDVSLAFNGTVDGLVDCYLTDPRSSFWELKHSARNDYEGAMKRIAADLGGRRVGALSAANIQELYDSWSTNGKLPMANSLVGRLRLLSGFGTVVLNNDDCIRLSSILHKMKFKGIPPRTERLTSAHAKAIRAAAHEMGWGSIALAQALQHDLDIIQRDVIGEWVPLTEPGDSDIIWGQEKWIRGLRWSQVDESLIVHHGSTSRRGTPKEFVFDLNKAQMVLEELKLIDPAARSGPLIICEATDRPFSSAEFRRKWRIVADKAGVPKTVRNADSARSGTDEPNNQDNKQDIFS